MCRPIILQNPKRTHLLKEKVNNKMAQQKKDKERFSAFLDELGKRLNKFRKSVLKTLGRATVLATIHGLAQRHELAGLFILYPPLPFSQNYTVIL